MNIYMSTKKKKFPYAATLCKKVTVKKTKSVSIVTKHLLVTEDRKTARSTTMDSASWVR